MDDDKLIALVTGGTSGVGLSIVRSLVKNHYRVFFIGTNKDKGKRIEKELNSAIKINSTFINLDLSDLKKVKEFTINFKENHSKLDLLANVAGVMLFKQETTNLGFDKTFTIGYLSAYLLSTELVPILKKGTNSRIVNVSGLPIQVLKPNLNFKNLDFKLKYNGFKTAIKTIHAKTVLTKILANLHKDNGIAINSFHPGTVKSDLTRNMPKALQILAKMASFFMSNESKNGIFVCVSKSINNKSGYLFVNKKAIPLEFEQEYMDKLIHVTKKLLKKQQF